MVLRKYYILLLFIVLSVVQLVAQELGRSQDYNVKRAMREIENLELTQNDSIVYGAVLLEFAKYCREHGLYGYSVGALDKAYMYLEEQYRKQLAAKDKYLSKKKVRFVDLIDFYFVDTEVSLMRVAMGGIQKQSAIGWSFLGYPPENIEVHHKNSLYYYEGVGKPDARDHIEAYAYAAQFYEKKGDWTQAEKYYLEALRLRKKFKVLSDEETNLLNNMLVTCYIQCSRLVDAEKLLFSLPNSKSSLANAVTLNNLANLAIRKREYTQANNLLKQAVIQYRASLPTLSKMIKSTLPPEFMSGLAYTATLYNQNGKEMESLNAFIELQQLLYATMKEYIPYMVYTDKSHLWLMMRDYFNQIQQYTVNHSYLKGAEGLLYDNNQLKKNIFLNSPVELIDPTLIETDAYLKYLDAKIDSLSKNEVSYHTHRGSDFIAKYKNDVLAMAYERDKLSYLRKQQWRKPLKSMGWENVQTSMNDGDIILEFLDYKDASTGKKQYGVLLLTKHGVRPEFIPLCSEDVLLRILNDKARNRRNERLYSRLWARIETRFYGIGVRSVFISPTGLINTISFAELKSNTTGQYLCENYNLHYLLNAEDIDRVNAEKYKTNHVHAIKNIYLFGGVDFGLPVHMISDVRSQGFGYLPGSKEEVNTISQSIKIPWKTHRFMGKNATEKNLRALSRRADVSVLHISTHGFYLPYDSDILTKGINNNGKSGYFDPLMRTGLMLSGANYAWKDPTKFDLLNDCIITAMDLGQIQLPYTELVVLSACNTGLGEIKDGEGVAGMQQSLRMVGVRSILLSLNDVPDKETSELMAAFYRNWQSGFCKSMALIRAQRDMRYKYPNNPEKWAGIILME